MVDENRKTRQDILQVLYDAAGRGKDGLRGVELTKELATMGNDVNRLSFNVRWLADKGYISYLEEYGFVKIEAKGIDHIEEKQDFTNLSHHGREKQIESSSITTISVNGPNYGTINATSGERSPIYFNQQITKAFNRAYSLVTDGSDIRYATEVQVMEKLKEMQTELSKKNNASKGKLEAGLEWLKEHTYEIGSIIEPFVLEAIGM